MEQGGKIDNLYRKDFDDESVTAPQLVDMD
jgi:hypothetical protein